ncbi:alpha/beta hydrolase fold domain-containing protein [Conexibacter sp. W3-3-2]|nr:alpha/beta hydrolase fold domain-containing protein [Conexibacter sp. W3-3-2]
MNAIRGGRPSPSPVTFQSRDCYLGGHGSSSHIAAGPRAGVPGRSAVSRRSGPAPRCPASGPAARRRRRWHHLVAAARDTRALGGRRRYPGEWVSAPGVARDLAVLHLHGGGFVLGSARSHRGLAAHLSSATGAPVFVPDYRRVPEHAHGAALDDADAAFGGCWSSATTPPALGCPGTPPAVGWPWPWRCCVGTPGSRCRPWSRSSARGWTSASTSPERAATTLATPCCGHPRCGTGRRSWHGRPTSPRPRCRPGAAT